MFLILRVKETFLTKELLGDQKGSDAKLVMFITKGRVTGLFTGIHFDWEMSAHTREDHEIYQIQTQNQANQYDWPEKTLKKYAIKMNQPTLRAELSL